MSGIKGMTHYDREIKEKAVKMFLEEHRSYRTIAEELRIRKIARIEAWVRMYRAEGEVSYIKPIGRPLKSESETHELERLRMENTLLKKFRTELRKV
jgi:transposase-like protein